jgi:hypothetical protein
MNYLKCIFAGLCFLVVPAILLVLGAMVFFAILLPKGQTIGIDVVSLVKLPMVRILAVLVFFLGYAWEDRRVASR